MKISTFRKDFNLLCTGATEKATVSHTEIIRASKVCAEGVASKPGDTLYSGILHTMAP